MKISKKQLRTIIREMVSGQRISPRKLSGRESINNTDRRGRDADLESEVRSAYKSGRSTPQGRQTQGIVDELFMMKNEPESFMEMEKDEFIKAHKEYSPNVPQEHVSWLYDWYIVLGREL